MKNKTRREFLASILAIPFIGKIFKNKSSDPPGSICENPYEEKFIVMGDYHIDSIHPPYPLRYDGGRIQFWHLDEWRPFN